MEPDRKRKRPAEDREPKRRSTGGDVGKPCAGAAVASRPPAAAADDDVDGEVEEFYAIVRRMHAAAREFSAGGASRGSRMAAAGGGQEEEDEEERRKRFNRWRPAFQWEDFEDGGGRRVSDIGDGGCETRAEAASATSPPVAAVGRGGKREQRTAVEKRIAICPDLNAEPDPESVLG